MPLGSARAGLPKVDPRSLAMFGDGEAEPTGSFDMSRFFFLLCSATDQ